MSISGIHPINSGPLVARLNLDTLLSGIYVVGISNYSESPIPSNYILITSSNGLLAPSNHFYVSSISVPSTIANHITLYAYMRSSFIVPLLYASTTSISNGSYQTINGSTIQSNNVLLTTLSTLGLTGNSITVSSLSGNSISSDNIQYTTSLQSNSTNIRTGIFSTISDNGNGVFYTSTLLSNNISTNQLFGNVLSTSIFSTSILILSTYSTTLISSINHNESTIIQNTIWVSSIRASSFSTNNLAFSLFNALYPITINLVASNMLYSSIYGSTIIASTIIGSTTTLTQILTSSMIFSTLTGSTITTSTLLGSTIYVPIIFGTSAQYSTLSGSTTWSSTLTGSSVTSYQYNTSTVLNSSIICPIITFSSGIISSGTISTANYTLSYLSTYSGSTIIMNTHFASTLFYSTLNTSFISTNQMLGTIINTSTFNGYMLTTSTIFTPNTAASSISVSTLIGSTISLFVLYASTMYGSTIRFTYTTASSITVPLLYISTMTSNSTATVSSINLFSMFQSLYSISTLSVSSVNGISLGLGAGSIPTNTAVGYQSLIMNTTGSVNTTMGYQSLGNTTIGSYQTAVGTNTLSFNLSGSYHTAVGSGAGNLFGFSGSYTTYIGYQAIPSGTSVTNECVIGGTNINTRNNIGSGSNSITLGNSGTVNTILYGNLGIGTVSPTTTLDVRGSCQIVGEGMKVINNNQYSQLYVISDDGVTGCGLFLNTSTRSADGGNYTGTFRNDYGTLRLQPAGGYTNPALGVTILSNGNVGINSNSPNNKVDIVGDMYVYSTITINGTLNTINNVTVNGTLFNYNTSWITIGTSIYTMNNVGIGNSNPGSYTLYITGNMTNTTTLIVDGSITSGAITCGSINSSTTDISCGTINSGPITCPYVTNNGDIITRDVEIYYDEGFQVNNKIPFDFTNDGWGISHTYLLQGSDNLSSGMFLSANWAIWSNEAGNYLYFSNPNNQTYGVYLRDNSSTWGALSDRRIKKQIQPIQHSLTSVLLLNPISYMLHDSSRVLIGLIAQEVQYIFPHLIEPSTNGSMMLHIPYDALIPYLISAFNEEHEHILNNEIKFTQLQYQVPELYNLENIHEQLLSHDERLSKLEALLNAYTL